MQIIKKEDAIGNRYFTGKPCKRGHIAERYKVSGECCECHALREKERRAVQRRRPAANAVAPATV